MKLKLGELYEVLWHDAYSGSGWRASSEALADTACVCYTVGYYVGKNKAGDLLFAASRGDGEVVGQVAGRPAGMIKKVTELKRGRTIRRR